MPAAVKRIQAGVYLVFLGDTVEEDELATTLEKTDNTAVADGATETAIVLDPIQLHNPLKVARLLPPMIPAHTSHIVVVGSTRSGAVLTERLAQKLPNVKILATKTQPQATFHARRVLGLDPEEAPSCDIP